MKLIFGRDKLVPIGTGASCLFCCDLATIINLQLVACLFVALSTFELQHHVSFTKQSESSDFP